MAVSEHNWHQIGHQHLLGTMPRKVYRCVTKHCGVTGWTTEHSWPPVRSPQYDAAAYTTCEGAIEARTQKELAKYGID